MNSSRNLIVALLALWLYAHNSNINLANNATFLLTLYALLSHGNHNENRGPDGPRPFPNGNNGGPNNQPNFGPQPPFGVPFNNGFGQPNFGTPFNNGFTSTMF